MANRLRLLYPNLQSILHRFILSLISIFLLALRLWLLQVSFSAPIPFISAQMESFQMSNFKLYKPSSETVTFVSFVFESGTVQYIRLLGCRCPVRVLVLACLVYQQTTQPSYLAVTRTTGRISVCLQSYPPVH